MLKLYDHQTKLINQARGALRQYDSVLLQAPTGCGKTVMAAYMVTRSLEKNKRAWFVCHRKELMLQTGLTFEKFDIPYGRVQSGRASDNSDALICSIGTLKNRVHQLPRPDLVIWDECHHVGAKGWAAVKDALPGVKHVGLSATPVRLDGRGLKNYFDVMVQGPTVSWLIDNEFLSDYRAFSVPIDAIGLKKLAGNYNKSEAETIMDKPSITGNIIKHYKKYSSDKRGIVFATSVKHSEHIAASMRASGIIAVHLDGKTPKKVRADICKDYADGKVQVLCNVDLFGEGFDIAAQAGRDITVESVVLGRPTQSLGLFLQQVGRALRRKPDKAIILDHAGNIPRHGFPDDDRQWTLHDKKIPDKEKDEEDIQVKQCKECFHCHRPAPKCPQCGYQYPVKPRKIEEVDGELIELDKRRMQQERKRAQGSAQTLDDLVSLGRKRGYKSPEKWAAHVYTARMKKYGRR